MIFVRKSNNMLISQNTGDVESEVLGVENREQTTDSRQQTADSR